MNLLKMPGCIFCGKRIRPWQKVRTAAGFRTKSGRISCHAKCYDRRFQAYVERHDD